MPRAALRTLLFTQAPWLLAAAAAGDEACPAGADCAASDDETALLQTRGADKVPGYRLYPAPSGMPTANQMARARARADEGEPAELTEPPVLKPPYKLKMQATYLPTPWIGGGYWTRGYGTIPGPTIKVKPGQLLKLEFENALGPDVGYGACDIDMASLGNAMNPSLICMLNTSNIHTHGLHVEGNGNGDNILRKAKPGETIHYEIQVPKNHMGGTHWYHPHQHHATAAQAGGGAHGALIVEDPEDYLPKQVAEMPEKILFLSLVNVAKCMRLESWGLSKTGNDKHVPQYLWKNDVYPNWVWDEVSMEGTEHGPDAIAPQLVANGQYHPKMTLEEDKWYRLRMTFASIEQRVELWVEDGDASCDFQLIAKDGVYLHSAPRPIERIHLTSGSRADVLVQCNCGYRSEGETCGAKIHYVALWQPFVAMGRVKTLAESSDVLMSLVVKRNQENVNAYVPDIHPFAVRRPCYLADLRTAEVARSNRHQLTLPMKYPLVPQFDGVGEVWAHHEPNPLARIPVGEVQEWQMSGMQFHPFHIHVNPFQITRISGDYWYMPGDWHDTFLPSGTNDATVRMNVDKFVGKMVAHCHILEHEDNGMMAWFDIKGSHGTTYSGNKALDSSCYEEEYPGPAPVAPAPAPKPPSQPGPSAQGPSAQGGGGGWGKPAYGRWGPYWR